MEETLNISVESKKATKFSYSKLNTYESCPWRYKLQYVDKHFIDTSSIANEFGTLIHFVEETIANDIIANNHEPYFMIDDEKYIDIFINAGCEDHSVKDILGAKKLKQKYPEEFETKDKYGYSYEDKANIYLNYGIYRLRDFLAANRHLQLIGVETPFDIEYGDFVFHGFIDRAFKNINTGEIIIEDIKTWQDIKGHDLVTPLQFVFYTQAAEMLFDVKEDQIKCRYELPLAAERHDAGTKGYMKRGIKKIDKLLAAIADQNFAPKPSPLCYWCSFSDTCPNQPDEGKNLCPYRSNWTKENKNFSVDFEWMGIDNHQQILEAYIKQQEKLNYKPDENIVANIPELVFNSNNHVNTDRIRIVRRA